MSVASASLPVRYTLKDVHKDDSNKEKRKNGGESACRPLTGATIEEAGGDARCTYTA